MQALGVPAYRFPISAPRVRPGRGTLSNEADLAFYAQRKSLLTQFPLG